MSKAAEQSDPIVERMKRNRTEAWATPEAARSRWGDRGQAQRLSVFEMNERAQRWAQLAKLLGRVKSDGYEIVQAAGWADSIGAAMPAEDVAALLKAARIAERLLGSLD